MLPEECPEAFKKQLIEMCRLATAGRLAAEFSHQINNSLGGILGYASMLLDETPENAPARRRLQIVVNETLSISKLVQSLLDFSRQHELVRHQIDLADTVREVVALLAHRAARSGAIVCEDYEEGLFVHVDKNRLVQALLNLLSYSICNSGGGEVMVKTWGEGPSAIASIAGANPCRGKDHAVFDPFDICDDDSSGRLSLYVCREIVRAEGGEVSSDMTSTGKVVFRISIPRPA